MYTCSIIGHRKIEVTEELKLEIKKVLLVLINRNGITTFLFGSRSSFIDLCYEIISELKKTYVHIKRVYVRAEYPIITKEYKSYLNNYYEDSFYYDLKLNSSRLNYVKRNETMVDMSDFCLFYCDVNYVPYTKTKSGTILAYNYAKRKKRNIINMFDSIN